MKTEKQEPKKHSPAEIESQKIQTDEQLEELDIDKRLSIHEAKDLIAQGVATLDFESDESGEPKSVIVRRVLDNSVVFYSDAIKDIKRFLD